MNLMRSKGFALSVVAVVVAAFVLPGAGAPGLAVGAVAGVVGFVAYRYWNRPDRVLYRKLLRMAHGDMTLAVPVDKADEVGMRWPISQEDVEDLFEVLAKRDVREPANWSRRFKNHQEKLKSGDVYQVAEVVRNLALRDQAKGLSAGEKSLYTKARNVLVSELAFALDVDEEAAMAKVDGALV